MSIHNTVFVEAVSYLDDLELLTGISQCGYSKEVRHIFSITHSINQEVNKKKKMN